MEGMIYKYQRCFIGPLKLHEHDNCYLKDVSIFLSFYLAMPYTMAPWCSGYDCCTTSLNQVWELKFCAGLNPASSVLEICDGKEHWQYLGWKQGVNAFRRSTILQKPFINSWFLWKPVAWRKRFYVIIHLMKEFFLSIRFKTITLFGDSFVCQGCTALL